MKLKTLLLGSAAAMIAVSGARAADAVVAEPEPMEYVKVCDMYGAGFFYIPGTETCMSINGYARVEYIYTDVDDNNAYPLVKDGDFVYRGRLNFDVRNETDYETLRSQFRFQGDGAGSADAAIGIDRLLISLGGLDLGYSDTFFTTNHGYGWQNAANDGFYTYDQAIMVQYTYAANGFSVTVGAQDRAADLGRTTAEIAASNANTNFDGSEDMDLYIGGSYSGSWGRVAATAVSEGLSDDMAYKVSLDLNLIENVGIHGWYAWDDGDTTLVTGYLDRGVENEWGVDISYQVNSEVRVWAGYTAYDGTAVAASGAVSATAAAVVPPFAAGQNIEGNRIAVGMIWDPVPGLSIRPEAVFGEDSVAGVDFDYEQYRVRVVRSW